MKHAAIVPLIGGMPLGSERAFGTRPDYLLSYSPFSKNDSHLVNYYKDTPYLLLDKGDRHPHYVDVVSATCPCAGLSSLSPSANANSSVNDWMMITAKYVLEEMKPQVFWGENAPRFGGKMGEPIVAKLHSLAKETGYTMTVYRTKSLLHGVPQVRERSFYFFWKGNRTPLINYFEKPRPAIDDLIRSVSNKLSQSEVTNKKIPSKDDPFYRYVLEVMEGGMSHYDFQKKITKSADVMHYIENGGHSYRTVKDFFLKEGYDRQASKLDAIQDKLDVGGNIMRRYSVIPKDYIGAFVGHLPTSLTHPDEDRYLTYRECMSIMGLPDDFTLLDPSRNLNHVCQNVPVSTATDMAYEIKAALEGSRDFLGSDLVYQFNSQKTHDIRSFEQPASLDGFLMNHV